MVSQDPSQLSFSSFLFLPEEDLEVPGIFIRTIF
jgi:hypothetical protein